MQKKISVLVLCLSVLMFSSCVTLPKKVKPGAAMTIGRVEVTTKNYHSDDGSNVNGTFRKGITISFAEWDTGKVIKVEADKDGYFYVSSLEAGKTYVIKRLDIDLTRSGINYLYWCEMSNPKRFYPIEGTVMNIGCLHVDFDGKTNSIRWNFGNPYIVKENFLSLDVNSEWLDMPIVDLR